MRTRDDSTTRSEGLAEGPPVRQALRGLYVHVPFCTTICGYCDFYVQRIRRGGAEPLVDALLRELARYRTHPAWAVETIFVGGGTPTTLAPDALRRLLTGLRQTVEPGRDCEFSIEVNPATVSPRVAEVLAETGVTRVSIGAQSFQPRELVTLERTHSPRRIVETVERCRGVGIRNINLDLIYAVPGQTLTDWRANLAAAVLLQPEHLSCYALTFEPHTPFEQRLRRGELQRAANELEADMFEATIDDLTAAGYEHYEISNFAKPGHACRHNLVYWQNDAHVGLGPAACGLVDGVRYKNVADLAEYTAAIAAGRDVRGAQECLAPEARAREAAMLRLRLRAGIDRADFQRRYELDPFAFFAEPIARFVSEGLLEQDEGSVRLTRPGLLLADRVVAEFL